MTRRGQIPIAAPISVYLTTNFEFDLKNIIALSTSRQLLDWLQLMLYCNSFNEGFTGYPFYG